MVIIRVKIVSIGVIRVKIVYIGNNWSENSVY